MHNFTCYEYESRSTSPLPQADAVSSRAAKGRTSGLPSGAALRLMCCAVLMFSSGACSDDKRSGSAEESIDGRDDRPSRDASTEDSGAREQRDAQASADGGAEAGPTSPPETDAGEVEEPDDEPETLYFADGGVIKFEEPEEPEEKELPQPGDELVNLSAEDGMDAGVAVTANSGGLQISNACLHMKLEDASFYIVEGDQPPNAYYEPVLNFVKTAEGFQLLAYFPWDISYPYFDAFPSYLPEGELIEVEVSRSNAAVTIAFQVEDSSVWIRSIVVVEFAL